MATLPTENDQSGGAEPEDGEISTYDNNLSDVKPENEERPNSPRAEELAPITDGATTSADAPVTDRQQEAHIEEGRGYDEVGGIVHTLDSDGSDADLQEQEAPNHTVQIEDIQDSTSVQEQGQERPATPISNLDVLDIDADIFKSPIVEQREPMKPVSTNVQFADGSNAFADDSAAKHVYHVSTLDTTRDEFAEWDLVESGLSGQEDQFSTLDASPKVAKRPRVDDEINDHLNSAPDLKRHRSQ